MNRYPFISSHESRIWYNEIASRMDISRKSDQSATDLLSLLLVQKGASLTALKTLEDQNVLIMGAGPSLEKDLEVLLSAGFIDQFTKISADGATSALINMDGRHPDFIVTDLDGVAEDQIDACTKGSFPIIHAHGDNVDLLKKWLPHFKKCIGTTQVIPRERVYNFGGFTDGDRALFIALSQKPRSVTLVGMDLGTRIGKYSNKPNSSRKNIKLQICKDLLQWIGNRHLCPLYNLTSVGEEIKYCDRVGIEDLDLIMGH